MTGFVRHARQRVCAPRQDLIKHGQAETGAGYELSVIYGQLGQRLPSPDQSRVKGPDNYAGRILAAIFSLGVYMFGGSTTIWASRTSTSPPTGLKKTNS